MGIAAFPFFVGIRLTKTEKALLDRMVANERTTMSAMIRECILREAIRPLFSTDGDSNAV